MKKLLLLTLLFITSFSYSQCIIDVPSSDGYTVHIEIEAVTLLVPSTCNSSTYNYNVDIDYDISFIGGGGSLYTLQGYLSCEDDTPFFNLPNNGGTGTTTTANATRNLVSDDCNTITLESLCGDFSIEIHGPGIPSQFVSCTALPIELAYFDAKIYNNNDALLTWATVSEINNDYFTIEKSYNAINFEPIGKVDGAGNSNEVLSYEFIDYNIQRGITYYRVKQTDYDGSFDYTPIRAISTDKENSNIDFDSGENIITITNSENAEFAIYTVTGVLLNHEILTEDVTKISTSNYSSGVYVIKILYNNFEFEMKKIVVY